MKKTLSRRTFLDTTIKTAAITAACAATGVPAARALLAADAATPVSKAGNRIVDIHTHFDAKNPAYLDEFLKIT